MSTLTVWRLCAAKYAATAYDGEGARLFGGRWSPPGVAIVYAAESRALATLEVLANADEAEDLTAIAWTFIAAEISIDLIEKPARLPETWRQFPHSIDTQHFGATWAKEKRSAVLRLPSAVVPGEFNYLLNPAHAGFKRIKIGKPEAFAFDPRITA